MLFLMMAQKKTIILPAAVKSLGLMQEEENSVTAYYSSRCDSYYRRLRLFPGVPKDQAENTLQHNSCLYRTTAQPS